jgi:phenolic acid decarboxylase
MSAISTTIYATRIEIRKLTGYIEGSMAICYENNYLYRFSATETTTDNDDDYLKPYDTIVGRWVKVKEFQFVELG